MNTKELYKMSKNLRALIIGNDIGQLVAANGLQQHGFHVEVFHNTAFLKTKLSVVWLTISAL